MEDELFSRGKVELGILISRQNNANKSLICFYLKCRSVDVFFLPVYYLLKERSKKIKAYSSGLIIVGKEQNSLTSF